MFGVLAVVVVSVLLLLRLLVVVCGVLVVVIAGVLVLVVVSAWLSFCEAPWFWFARPLDFFARLHGGAGAGHLRLVRALRGFAAVVPSGCGLGLPLPQSPGVV